MTWMVDNEKDQVMVDDRGRCKTEMDALSYIQGLGNLVDLYTG